jgi:hypothetical protein
VPGESNGFEAGMGAECPEQVADVIANRLDAQVELAGDLVSRMAPLEQPQHLGLPRGEMRM